MPKENISPEEELVKEGWVRKFIAAEPQLSEYVKLYESLGFEVHLEPVTSEKIDQGCEVCYEGEEDKYKIIYTRKKGGG